MEAILRDVKTNGQDKIYHFHEVDTVPDRIYSNSAATKKQLVFVSGNQSKIEELSLGIGKSNKFQALKLDLLEIQHSNVLQIVQHKCLDAFHRINQLHGPSAVLIEDTSLEFKALNGMPGPYIKWFLQAIGCEGLVRMLEGFEDKSAEAVCIYALMEQPDEMILFRGTVQGEIVAPRSGPTAWGWDPIFQEERTRLTFGEMDQDMKMKFSHRCNALTILKKFLASRS